MLASSDEDFSSGYFITREKTSTHREMLGGAGLARFAGDECREPIRVEGGRAGEGTDLRLPTAQRCCCCSRRGWGLKQRRP